MVEWWSVRSKPDKVKGFLLGSALLLTVAATGCKRTKTYILPAVNLQDSKYFAFLTYRTRDPDYYAPFKLWVLNLSMPEKPRSWPLDIPEGWNPSWACAWRPKTSPQELYYILEEKHPERGHRSIGRLVRVQLHEGSEPTGMGVLEMDWLDTVMSLKWNPSGTVLAAADSELRISFDEGETFVRSDVSTVGLRDQVEWTDDETLYLIAHEELLEVKVHDGKARVNRTLARGDTHTWFLISGTLDSKLVYRLGNKVFLDGRLFYESEEPLGSVLAYDKYVVIDPGHREDRQLKILDTRGNIYKTFSLPAGTGTIGLDRSYLDLLKDRQTVMRAPIDHPETQEVIFSVAGHDS